MALSKKTLIIGSLVLLLIVVVSVVVLSGKSSSQSSALVTRVPTTRTTTMAPTTMVPNTMTKATMSANEITVNNLNTQLYNIPKFPSIQNGQNYLLQNQVMEAPYLGVFNNQSAYLSSPPYRFYLQTDGNLVIYKTDVNPWTPIWASNTQSNFQNGVMNTITSPDTKVTSYTAFPTDGSVMLRLILNSVGDLILYYYIVPNQASASKQGAFSGSGQASASLSDIYSTSGLVPVWNTNTANKGGTRLVIQSDSNLVIYRNEKNTSPVWSTITGML